MEGRLSSVEEGNQDRSNKKMLCRDSFSLSLYEQKADP